MPYLNVKDKEYYMEFTTFLSHYAISTPGELNYLVTELIKQAMKDKTISYTLLNGIVGALDCAKEEFRRRVVNPYEDNKIKLNGDVYDMP